MNFKPEGELHLSCIHSLYYENGVFNYEEHELDQRIAGTLPITKAANSYLKRF